MDLIQAPSVRGPECTATVASTAFTCVIPPKAAVKGLQPASAGAKNLEAEHDSSRKLPKSHSEQQLPRELHPALLEERNRRVLAEQQVEAEKQACLELTRLLDLERQKFKQQSRRVSTISLGSWKKSDPPISILEIPSNDTDSSTETEREEPQHKKEKQKEKGCSEGIPSPFECIAPREDDIGQLSARFLFDKLSSTVFEQLPRDLQNMLQVESGQEDGYDEGQPPSVLSLAYRAIRTDNPRQLKEHLMVIGEAILQSVEGAGLLGEACECGSDGCVRVLLDSGCSPDHTCRVDGMSAIHLAAQNDHASCISLLLKWGGNASLSDADGQTPLFIALCEGYRECVDLLLEAGSSLEVVTKMDYTVLHAAVSGNMADVLRRLLVSLRTAHDSNTASHIINYRDGDGNTALHLAASRGYQQCVEVLCGCPQTILTVKDRWNRTALDISTADCRDILMSKDSKEMVVCVQARLPDTRQATPIAIGRVTILRHYKCLDVELLAAQTLDQYCHNLKGHIPMTMTSSLLESDTESCHSTSAVSTTTCSRRSSAADLPQSEQQTDSESHTEWAESDTVTWADRLQDDLHHSRMETKSGHHGGRNLSESVNHTISDLKYLRESLRGLAKMDLGGQSIASYRVGPLSWAPGELGKQQRAKSLHAMVGDRRGGGLGWITGGKPTEIHITLKGHTEGHLDQLAFELMIPKATLHHYISMVIRDKAVVLHGPQGCGKTYLAKSIAEFIKHKLGANTTHILYISLHPSFKRDDLFRMLRLNGLLKMMNEQIDREGENLFKPNPHVVILDDLDRISGYSTPSILAELLTTLNYRGPLNPTWMNAVYSREGKLLYPAGMYYLKTASYFIATRTQAIGEALPAAVMDQFSHIPLARHGEPCSGVLYRQLVSRLIHTRHGDTPHRWDKLYRCVCWVWELWQLYNNYMKQLDLAELSLGLKHMLQCPVESGSSDNIQSWLCQLWEHHVSPRIEETVLHSRRLEGQHHQQTAQLLLRAVVDRALRPTCPLEIGAATVLLESLYPPSPFKTTPLTCQKSQQRHSGNRVNVPFGLQATPNNVMKIPVHSVGSAPVMGTSDYGNTGSESPNTLTRKRKVSAPTATSQTDTTSLDRVKIKQSSRSKLTLRRLRSRTVSLFSKDTVGLPRGGGGGGGGGERGSEAKKSPNKTKETGSTLPRIFKKTKMRTPLPALAEKRISQASPGSSGAGNTHELEDFFDMLSLASSNRFDDQRSPAPKALVKGTHSPPISPVPNEEGGPVDEFSDAMTPSFVDDSGFPLNELPPPLAMSLPDLLSEDTEPEPRSNSVGRLYSIPTATKPHSNPPLSDSYDYITPRHREQRQSGTGAPDESHSEPLRRRIIHREANIVGDEFTLSTASGSPSVSNSGHRASPLATTTYVYSPTMRKTSEDEEIGEEVRKYEESNAEKEEESEQGYKMEAQKGGGDAMIRDSPDGKYPSEVQVGDVGLPQRTFPDGAAVRHPRTSPSEPGRSPQPRKSFSSDDDTAVVRRSESGVREGWVEKVVTGRRGSPGARNNRTSAPITSYTGNAQLQSRRVLSEGDRCQSLDEILEAEEARSTHILIDAGLNFLTPDSPIFKGVQRGQSFSGGSPKLNVRKRPPISEHHEM